MVGRFWRKQMEIFVLSTTNEGASRVGFLFWQPDAPCSNWLFIAYIDRCVISANFGSEFCLRHGTARCAHLMVPSFHPGPYLLRCAASFLVLLVKYSKAPLYATKNPNEKNWCFLKVCAHAGAQPNVSSFE